ncbi:uncharacterized protein [Onthophagus taurus]|uniref:uncharacterized protein n=1 Tax=Onthophagus taurus TaxID=166361 RepID=UPI0039BE4CB5
MKGHILTFLLQIPLIEMTTYQYYHLIPLPIKQQSHYLILNIPQPYLAENKDKYFTTGTKCKEFQREEYLCQATSLDTSKRPTCAYEILRHLPISMCTHKKTSRLQEESIHPTESEWILFQANSTGETVCEDRQEVHPLEGNLLIQITPDCSVHLGKEILRTTTNNLPDRQFHLAVVNLSTIPEEKSPWQLENIHMKNLQLATINDARTNLTELDQRLREFRTNHLFSLGSSMTSLIGTVNIIILIIILVCFRKGKKVQDSDNSVTQVPERSSPNPWLTLRREELPNVAAP